MSAVQRKTEPNEEELELAPMRRRHLRSVLRIETLVYPRPWSMTLFLQEIARRKDRFYLVARSEGEVVGYGGVMTVGSEAHVTTIAVDPLHQRRRIGTRIFIALLEASIERGARAVSLEVRKSNFGAQRLYEKFGFRPVGVRKGYYIETGEDAIVMWAEEVDRRSYSQLLDARRSELNSPE